MAKKNKKNIKQLIAKKQQLHALEQGYTVTIPEAGQLITTPQKAELPPAAATHPEQKALADYRPGKEIWRTVITVAIITVLLVGLILADSRYHFLDGFGDRLYNLLRLGE